MIVIQKYCALHKGSIVFLAVSTSLLLVVQLVTVTYFIFSNCLILEIKFEI